MTVIPLTEQAIRPTPRRVPLNGLQCARAIAAISVAGYHALERMSRHSDLGWLFEAFRFGNLGVDLFFVISGFIILHIHARDVGHPSALKRYLYRRATRIYPLYWIVFIGVLPLYFFFPDAGDGSARDPMSILRCLFLLPNPGGQIIGVAWTLVFELSFYAFFALFIINKRLGLAALALWAVVLAVRTAGVDLGLGPVGPYVQVRYLEFALGAGIHLAMQRWRPSGGVIIALTGLAGLFFGGLIYKPLGDLFLGVLTLQPGSIIVAGLIAAVAIFGIVARDFRSQADSSPAGWPAILVALGNASYSIYLFHWLIGWITDKAYSASGLSTPLLDQVVFVLMFVAMIAGGYTIHIMLERPLMRLLARSDPGARPVPA